MYCPSCGEKYAWYETMCRECQVELVEQPPGPEGRPDLGLVPVFRTEDAALMPLAKLALEGAGINYVVRYAEDTAILTQRARRTDYTGIGGAVMIFVTSEDEARARELLDGLTHPHDIALPPFASADAPVADLSAPMAVELCDADTGIAFGRISDGQLQTLINLLEEGDETDHTYYIDAATIEMLADAGAEAHLVDVLRNGLGARDGCEVRWSQ